MIWGFNPGRAKRSFSSPKMPRPALGPTQPPIQWVRGSLLELKWLRNEVAHLPPSSTEVKNAWSCTFTPHVCFHGVDRYIFIVYPYQIFPLQAEVEQ